MIIIHTVTRPLQFQLEVQCGYSNILNTLVWTRMEKKVISLMALKNVSNFRHVLSPSPCLLSFPFFPKI